MLWAKDLKYIFETIFNKGFYFVRSALRIKLIVCSSIVDYFNCKLRMSRKCLSFKKQSMSEKII